MGLTSKTSSGVVVRRSTVGSALVSLLLILGMVYSSQGNAGADAAGLKVSEHSGGQVASMAAGQTAPAPALGSIRSESSQDVLLARSLKHMSPNAHAVPSGPASSDPVLMHATRQAAPLGALTKLMESGQWSLPLVMAALASAAILGAFHALEPGHGKILIASYLAGSDRSAREAALLALIVTAIHTGGVYPIGVVALYASCYVFPERIYPWLGIASGLTIFGIGCLFFMQRYLQRVPAYAVQYCLSCGASMSGMEQPYGVHRYCGIESGGGSPLDACMASKEAGRESPVREILSIGVAGGIVPCPAAMFVLLSAIALHRVAYGLVLVLAFSIGLASVLIALGLMSVYSRGLAGRLYSENSPAMRWLPLASAVIMALTGLIIATNGFMSAGAPRM